MRNTLASQSGRDTIQLRGVRHRHRGVTCSVPEDVTVANKYTKMADAERRRAAAEINQRKAEAEAKIAEYNRERGAAEKKARDQKKIVNDCLKELAELASA